MMTVRLPPAIVSLAALAIVMLVAGRAEAQTQPGAGGMPNLRAMSGKPLPDRGMAPGTVSVRVARRTPANAVANVEITALTEAAGGESRKRTAKTDVGGRALFEGVPAGQRFHAEVVVDGEKLETESFTIPEVGGIRTMLIAGLGDGAGAGDGNGEGEAAGEPDPGGGDKRRPFRLGIISGTARVDLALPAGAIEVRALDEAGRPLAGREIELARVMPDNQIQVTRQVTSAEGITRFAAVPGRGHGGAGEGASGTAGGTGAAVAMQYGELRLGSDGFGTPATGGVSVELRAPVRTADPSIITIGAGGRLILQMRDDSPGFIETLPLENHSDKLFDPGPGGVEIPLPTEFANAEVAEGEHKVEIRKGIGIAVHGMIPPRRPQPLDANRKSPDEVTFGFVMPPSGSTRSFEQRFPTGIGDFTFISDQIPGMTIESAQITGRQERELSGKKYWLWRGEAIPPGGTLRFTLHGLPAADNVGRMIAAALALALVGAAVVFARRGGRGGRRAAADERDQLVQRRERLFSELVALEVRETGERSGRGELVQKLEAVYRDLAALDEQHAV